MLDDVKFFLDIGAVGAAFGTLFGLIPHLSSLLAVIWLGLRIYESRTVQRWLKPTRSPPKTRAEDD